MYLNLMKSIWVLQQVRKGEEYATAASDRLWDCYIEELEKVGGEPLANSALQQSQSTY